MIATLVRLVYHDVPCIGLELEVADAILLNVSHHIGEHAVDATHSSAALVNVRPHDSPRPCSDNDRSI